MTQNVLEHYQGKRTLILEFPKFQNPFHFAILIAISKTSAIFYFPIDHNVKFNLFQFVLNFKIPRRHYCVDCRMQTARKHLVVKNISVEQATQNDLEYYELKDTLYVLYN